MKAAAKALIAGLMMAGAALLAPAASAAPTLNVEDTTLSLYDNAFAGHILGPRYRGRDSKISVSNLTGTAKTSITLGGTDAGKFALTCDYADEGPCIPVNANVTAEATATLTTAGSGAAATATIDSDVGTVESVYFTKPGTGYVPNPTSVRIVGACDKPGPDGQFGTADDLSNQTEGPDGIKGTSDDCEGVGGGVRAGLTFTLNASGGVASITVTEPGKNHISTPRVEARNLGSNGTVGGTGFTGTVTSTNDPTTGVATVTVNITSAGTGYHKPAALVISGGGGGSGLSLTKPIVDDVGGLYGSVKSTGCDNPHRPVTNGCLDIDMEAAGSGYVAIPTVTVVGGGGSGAEVAVVVKSSEVKSIALDTGKRGTDYDQRSTSVTIAEPPAGPGARRATARAVVLADGRISAIVPVDKGAGYLVAPTVTITSFAGVASIALTAGKEGSGYETAPKVTITAPPTSSATRETATATAVLKTDGSGAIDEITIGKSGKGYTTAPTVTIAAPTLETGVTTAKVSLRTKAGVTYVAGTTYNIKIVVSEAGSTAVERAIVITTRAGGSIGGRPGTGPAVENQAPEFPPEAKLGGLTSSPEIRNQYTWICNRSTITWPAAIDPDGTGSDSKIEYHIQIFDEDGQAITDPEVIGDFSVENKSWVNAALGEGGIEAVADSQWDGARYLNHFTSDAQNGATYILRITPRDTAYPRAYGATKLFSMLVTYNSRASNTVATVGRWGDTDSTANSF